MTSCDYVTDVAKLGVSGGCILAGTTMALTGQPVGLLIAAYGFVLGDSADRGIKNKYSITNASQPV